MVSTCMKERGAQVGGTLCVVPSSWGYSYPPSQCAEDIINPAKGPKHKQGVQGYCLLSFFIVCP